MPVSRFVTLSKRLPRGWADKIAEREADLDAAYVIDSTKARIQLGWSPWIDFVTGIDEVVAWVETNWDVLRKLPWEYQHKA